MNNNFQGTSEVVSQAKDILTITDVSIFGVLISVIGISWFIIWRLWLTNESLNKDIKGFIEKYYVLSTKVLTYIRKGVVDE